MNAKIILAFGLAALASSSVASGEPGLAEAAVWQWHADREVLRLELAGHDIVAIGPNYAAMLDGGSGQEKWRWADGNPVGQIAVAHDVIWIPTSEALVLVSRSDGQTLKDIPLDSGDRVIAVRAEGDLVAVHWRSSDLQGYDQWGDLRWQHERLLDGHGDLEIQGGTVLAVDRSRHLLGLDAGNGQTLWRSTGDSYQRFAGTPGVVLAEAPDGYDALSSSTGEVLWSVDLERRLLGPPPGAGHDVAVAAGLLPCRIVAIDLLNGQLKWDRDLPNGQPGRPVVGQHLAVVRQYDAQGQDEMDQAGADCEAGDNLSLFDAQSGSLRWRHEGPTGPAMVLGDQLIVASGTTLYAVRPVDDAGFSAGGLPGSLAALVSIAFIFSLNRMKRPPL